MAQDDAASSRRDTVGLIGRALLAVATSVAMPILAEVFIGTDEQPITAFEDVAIAGLTFLILAASEATYRLVRIESLGRAQEDLLTDQQRREEELWLVRDQIDERLANIRMYFRLLTPRNPEPTGLYRNYFVTTLNDYIHLLEAAATTGTMPVQARHLETTDRLLDCLAGAETDVFRAVHCLRNNEFFFDMHSNDYFHRVFDLVREGRIRGVRRLLTYNSIDELTDDRTLRMLAFHLHNELYDYHLLDDRHFRRMIRDYEIGEDFVDFGIYGDRYLYLSEEANDSIIRGKFKSNPEDVQKYINLFNKCWRSPLAWTIDRASQTGIPGFDDIAEVRLRNCEITADDLFNDSIRGGEYFEFVQKS